MTFCVGPSVPAIVVNYMAENQRAEFPLSTAYLLFLFRQSRGPANSIKLRRRHAIGSRCSRPRDHRGCRYFAYRVSTWRAMPQSRAPLPISRWSSSEPRPISWPRAARRVPCRAGETLLIAGFGVTLAGHCTRPRPAGAVPSSPSPKPRRLAVCFDQADAYARPGVAPGLAIPAAPHQRPRPAADRRRGAARRARGDRGGRGGLTRLMLLLISLRCREFPDGADA